MQMEIVEFDCLMQLTVPVNEGSSFEFRNLSSKETLRKSVTLLLTLKKSIDSSEKNIKKWIISHIF